MATLKQSRTPKPAIMRSPFTPVSGGNSPGIVQVRRQRIALPTPKRAHLIEVGLGDIHFLSMPGMCSLLGRLPNPEDGEEVVFLANPLGQISGWALHIEEQLLRTQIEEGDPCPLAREIPAGTSPTSIDIWVGIFYDVLCRRHLDDGDTAHSIVGRLTEAIQAEILPVQSLRDLGVSGRLNNPVSIARDFVRLALTRFNPFDGVRDAWQRAIGA